MVSVICFCEYEVVALGCFGVGLRLFWYFGLGVVAYGGAIGVGFFRGVVFIEVVGFVDDFLY